METEHDSEPLISPRGDEPENQPVAGGEEPLDENQRGIDPEPEVGRPIEAPAGDALAEPAEPPEDLAEPGRDVGEPVGGRRAGEPRTGSRSRAESPNMLPSRKARGHVERSFVRVIATGGIVGICVAIAAIMSSSNSQGWVIGLVVSLVSVVLAALLWSSRIL
jgi:hypothetical protein